MRSGLFDGEGVCEGMLGIRDLRSSSLCAQVCAAATKAASAAEFLRAHPSVNRLRTEYELIASLCALVGKSAALA